MAHLVLVTNRLLQLVAVLYGAPVAVVEKPQIAQNNVARVICQHAAQMCPRHVIKVSSLAACPTACTV